MNLERVASRRVLTSPFELVLKSGRLLCLNIVFISSETVQRGLAPPVGVEFGA